MNLGRFVIGALLAAGLWLCWLFLYQVAQILEDLS